ncbi:hypothetical protein NL53_08595 [Vibrio variabilis]|uniref:Carbohydrate deacetylase n=1 Tax=Vibrio variabilis TaxID=990271 RepID=A0ABR4YBU9_9VIBR|nr:chitin disaccharide deacetylase [Vibrio variabilis]KHA60961.1 hypothetical protein NL53_08595 [Vibrio variabilis]
MKVIFNADDFGLTKGVNEGIVRSHLEGVVRSTTLLVGLPEEEHAVALAKKIPTLKVGIHLRFTLGAPLTRSANLSDKNGAFYKYAEFWSHRGFSAQAIYDECIAQVEAFLATGLTLSHIDSHHHAHTHPEFLPVVTEVAAKYRVPLRGQSVPNLNYFFTDQFYDQGVDLMGLVNHLLELEKRYELVEVMCHPAIVDQVLAHSSGYSEQRKKELNVLTDDKLATLLERHSIEVTDYSALSIQRT